MWFKGFYLTTNRFEFSFNVYRFTFSVLGFWGLLHHVLINKWY